ncbi:MAG: ion transporter, partial [Bacteroidetes bacterium]|nr:ion transporter [Bacteroidota bacterium]
DKIHPLHIAINTFIIVMILLNLVAVIIQSEQDIYYQYAKLFDGFEAVSIIIFSVEYLLRLWVCVEDEKYKNPVSGRLKYIFSLSALIDALAILPFYLPLLLPIDVRFIRIFRVLRIVRLYKMNRFFGAGLALEYVYKTRKEQLLFSFVFIIGILTITSCFMFLVEHEAQPDKFTSIPRTMWWCVSMLTVVKFSSPIFPVTFIGKILGALIALIGLGIFALPTGIISSGLVDYAKEKHKLKEENKV